MDIDLDLPIERIFKESLGLRKGEKILLITDDYDDIKNRFNDRKFIAQCFKKVASKFDSPLDIFVYSAQKNHGEEPPIDLWLKCFGQSFCNSFFKYLSYEDVKNKKVYLEELLKYEDKVDKNHFPDVIIAISYFSTSHTLFRKFANYLGCRYASMPMVEKEMFAGPLNIDYNDLEKKTLELGKKIIDYKG
ncbi:MAG: hypothetical protein N2999_08030, partial [Proteobacteria bacterium]|nr:hypothetical protein [Pseudomonadota bacterium]